MVETLFAITQVLILGENSQRDESLREREREARVNGKEGAGARVESAGQTGEDEAGRAGRLSGAVHACHNLEHYLLGNRRPSERVNMASGKVRFFCFCYI